jgi:hypothetical protein
VFIEALRAGLPVLAHDFPVSREVLQSEGILPIFATKAELDGGGIVSRSVASGMSACNPGFCRKTPLALQPRQARKREKH